MEINKEVLTLSDIVDICNSDVSNWIESDTSFPKPLKKTPAGSIWKTEDIIDYLYKKEDSSTVISKANLKTKTIAIIGRARSGKSFFNSRFVKDRVGFTKLFCGNNIDKTVCPNIFKFQSQPFWKTLLFIQILTPSTMNQILRKWLLLRIR